MPASLAPTAPDRIDAVLRERGYAVADPQGVRQLTGTRAGDLRELAATWDDLAPDPYLEGGARYRKRRHSCFVADAGSLRQVPHRGLLQPAEDLPLYGGQRRWGPQSWHVEAHQFRVDTEGGIGRPTPEGPHRDGVELAAVFLVARERVSGGVSRVAAAGTTAWEEFTLCEPWSLLLLDDERMIHEATPIRPEGGAGHRDTLVITCRAGGFLGG